MLREGWRDRSGALPDRLAAELRDAIAMGRLPPGTPLPSERALSVQAGVSRTTISATVDLLVATGWAVRRVRARSVARLPDAKRQALARSGPGSLALDGVGASIAAPAELVFDALDRARMRLTPYLLGDGHEPVGQGDLRALVAERLTAEGLATHPAQVLMTNGAMGALSALLDDSVGTILVEDPTYHRALRLASGRRRRLLAWTRGWTWDCDELARIVRRTRPAITYVVPDFHNPTGALASAAERSALAALGAELGTVVVDETLRDIDLRPLGSTMPPHLAALLPAAVTVGGLAKTVWSGLRVGWMRVPDPEMRARLARLIAIHPVPLLEQLVAVELWPSLGGVTADRVARLRAQRDVLVAGARTHGLGMHVPEGGLVCWVDLGRPVASLLAERMFTRGVAIAPGGRFSVRRTFDQFIRIPFTLDGPVLTTIIDTLAQELATIPTNPSNRQARPTPMTVKLDQARSSTKGQAH